MNKKKDEIAPALLLGSASPRRSKILRELGVRFDVEIPGVEEVTHDDDPGRTVRENALRKNAACRSSFPDRCILTADTIVVFNGKCIEKPESLDQAFVFLRMLSGQVHKVLTGVMFSEPGLPAEAEVVVSVVRFKDLTEDEMAVYFDVVDPMDKAGAYDVDQYGHMVIESLEGSRTNVMGLPRESVERWLRQHPEFLA
jgi:septum formation protein